MEVLSMSRFRLVVIGVLAVAAVCAMAVSSASAVIFELTTVRCVAPEDTTTICWALFTGEELFELKGEQSFTGEYSAEETGEENLLAAKFGEEEVHITCTGATSKGTVLQPKPLEVAPVIVGVVVSTGCKVLEPLGKKCDVPETLTTSEIEGVVGPTDEEVVFSPSPADLGVFIAITFTNNGTETCPAAIKGERKVTGSQACLWVKPTEDLEKHLLWCQTAGSKLKFSGNAAEFLQSQQITLVKLEDFWDIVIA
jgi:hypothetical protein